MAKTTTPEQHRLLHVVWPNDCCLCSHEQALRALEAKLIELRRWFDTSERQLSYVDKVLPGWQYTGRGRIETINQLKDAAVYLLTTLMEGEHCEADNDVLLDALFPEEGV